MEIFLSAVLGELVSRSMSFFISRCLNPAALEVEDSLQRVLLRAQVIADEAAGRCIPNRAMLQQLSMLRDAMFRGHYLLDAFRYHQDQAQLTVSHTSALSKFSYARCFSFSNGSRQTAQELQEMVESLNTMILDMSELLVFLSSYPRLCRQPYSMHLLLDKCMFGRQIELELVINFLLHRQPHGGTEFVDVLPIVGPGRVGKSTLVAHVCEDERVREHFSQIIFLREDDFKGEKPPISMDKFSVARTIEENRRLLIVVEVAGDLNEEAWKELYFGFKQCATNGSKVIITSRSDKIMKLGTTHPLTLKPLPEEAYWYFFKVITFGSMDPNLHPKHACLAMEIARMLKGSFTAANCTASTLRANFSIHFWCKVLEYFRGYIEKYVSMFGQHPCDHLHRNKPIYVRRLSETTEDLFMSDHHETCSSQEEFPKITFEDVVFGNAKPHGTFRVLAWKSRIPPYGCDIYTCQLREVQTKVVKRKRSLDNSAKNC